MMPRSKAITVWIGIGFLVATGVYPPWMHTFRSYGWIFFRPGGSSAAVIDMTRLVVEWMIIAAVTAGFYFAPPKLNVSRVINRWKRRPKRAEWSPPPLPKADGRRLLGQLSWGVLIGVGLTMAAVIVYSRMPHRAPEDIMETVSTPAAPEAPASVAVIEPPVEIPSTVRKQQPPTASVATPTAPRYDRPALAPNGEPWPATSGYVSRIGNNDGHSEVTVDNTQNGSDMLVKLFDRQFRHPVPIRMIFLRAHEMFGFKTIRGGDYDIRYQNLDSGTIWKSQPFSIEETEDGRHIDATSASLTLYEIPNGNTHAEIIGPEDFQ